MATTAKSTRKRTPKKKLTRAELIRSIRGKYKHLPISSEEYAAEKRLEIEREDRVR
jgi:hypothetical protein